MRYIKIFEDFNQSFKIGDMVYVNVHVLPNGTMSQFNKDTKYQIVYIEDRAFLYDEFNDLVSISFKNLFKELIDFELVKDYFISSIEEFLDSDIERVQYDNRNIAHVGILLKLRRNKVIHLSKNPPLTLNFLRHKILAILNTEFKNRLEDEGYSIEMDHHHYRYSDEIYVSVIRLN